MASHIHQTALCFFLVLISVGSAFAGAITELDKYNFEGNVLGSEDVWVVEYMSGKCAPRSTTPKASPHVLSLFCTDGGPQLAHCPSCRSKAARSAGRRSPSTLVRTCRRYMQRVQPAFRARR